MGCSCRKLLQVSLVLQAIKQYLHQIQVIQLTTFEPTFK